MINIIHKIEENIIAFLLVAMTLLVFTETILRFLGTGILWAEELTLHLSAWLVLFGASYGLRVSAHIGVDFVVKKFSDNTQRAITLVMLSAALLYCGLFIYGAWVYLSKMHMIGIELEDLPIQKWQAHSILLIGFVLIGLRLFEIMLRVIKGEQTRLEVHDEADDSKHLQAEFESQMDDALEAKMTAGGSK